MTHKAPTEASYLRALAQACSPEDWQTIISTIVQQAKEGDLKSASFLAKYLLKEQPSLAQVQAWQATGHDPVKSEIRQVKKDQQFDHLFGSHTSEEELDRLLESIE